MISDTSQPPSNDESTENDDDDDHNASTFCTLADQLSAESNRPRNSTTLERSVRQLTLIFQSLPFEHQKRVLLHLAKSQEVDRTEVRDKARTLLDVGQNDDPAFVRASEDLRAALTPPYRYHNKLQKLFFQGRHRCFSSCSGFPHPDCLCLA